MKKCAIVLLLLAVIFAAVIASRQGDKKAPVPVSMAETGSLPGVGISRSTPPSLKPVVESARAIQPVAREHPEPPTVVTPLVKTPAQPKSLGGTAPIPKGKEPIQDPEARAALGLVGTDPDAELYWVAAINDPSLGADERKDLIEDLNEDGLSDPKHPGPDDVPLIMNRLELIEELAPFAMDQVNADAFAEAYKDLADMLAGKPVK